MKLMMFLFMSMTMSLALISLGHIMPKRKTSMEKKTPYECGFDPMKSARLPFSFRFFLMAILFLMFDLEMALLFPMLPAMSWDIKNLLTFSSMFMILLAGGLAYEWKQGGLEWAE